MAEIKWIKIATDIFDDEKILLIESMPEADAMIVIWFKLLAFAGKSNNNGVFMLSDKIPYTDEMLSTIFRRPLNTVRMALQTFEQFGMIEHINGVLTISKWGEHQNIDGMDKIREQNRLRAAKHRAVKKQLLLENNDNGTRNVTVTQDNAIEEDKDKDEEKEEDKDKRIDYQQIADMFNNICLSFSKIRSLSEARKKAIKARFNNGYTLDDFKDLFTNAEESDFLKGSNDRGWQATFDWLIKETNMVKVLEGNYKNKQKPNEQKNNDYDYLNQNGSVVVL